MIFDTMLLAWHMGGARMMSLEKAVEDVREAIENEGPVPEFHRKVMAKHREEWPTLWRALDSLLRVQYGREED